MCLQTAIRTHSSLVVALENPHQAKRRLRMAWHLEDELLHFLDLQKTGPLFFFVCAFRKASDGTHQEVIRVITHHDKGVPHLPFPSFGVYIIGPFLMWPGETDWRIGRNLARRSVTRNSFTRKYECGILNYGGEIDTFYRYASGPADADHTYHRMRTSVMGPDYFLYDGGISKEIKVVK